MDESLMPGETGANPAQHRVSHKDLRDLLRDFEAMREVKTIEGADPHLEISALAETLTMRYPGEEPALLFDKIKGFKPGYRILSGASNSFRRLAHVYGLPTPEKKIDIVKSFKSLMGKGRQLIPPKIVPSGPIFENVQRDDEVDIFKFPIPFVHEHDGGRYIGTEDLVVMRDPDSDWINVGTYRIVAHSKNEVGVWISPGKHGRAIREKYFAKGQPCPVLISCGQDPILFLCSNAELPYGVSELDYAGGQRGSPVEVVLSELYKLPMPAGAEIVLEGEMYGDKPKLEGPFGEFMGYYASEASEQPTIRIRRVYHRNDPIITLAIPSRPPSNFTVARAVVKAAMIWDEMEKGRRPRRPGRVEPRSGRGPIVQCGLDQADVCRTREAGGHARGQLPVGHLCRALGCRRR